MKIISLTVAFAMILLTLFGCASTQKRVGADSGGDNDKTNDSVSSDSGGTSADDDYDASGVYSSQFLCKNIAYYNVSGAHLMYSLLSEDEKSYYACIDPFCEHNDANCAGYLPTVSYMLTVPRESGMPLVYMFGGRYIYEYVDGEYIEHSPEYYQLSQVVVFDPETGEKRTVAETDFTNVQGAWYYEGKIFFSYESLINGAAIGVGVIDTETGKYTAITSHGDPFATGAGIWDGRFYYINDRGEIYSCDVDDVNDKRKEYDIGVQERHTDRFTMRAYADCGMLYFERDCIIPQEAQESLIYDLITTSNVYAVDLNDKDAGETLVAENVLDFKPYNGDLYYNVLNYVPGHDVGCADRFTRVTSSSDGGTLYRYDHKTKTSDTCYTDCGTSIYEIYDIDGEHMLFWGTQYRDVENYNTHNAFNTRYFHNYMCSVDLDTGDWHVLCNTYTDPQIELEP